VVEGRRNEFARFPAFQDPARRARIPDPQDERTVRRSTLDWRAPARPEPRRRRAWTRRLLRLRQREVVPLLAHGPIEGSATRLGATGLAAEWSFAGGATLRLVANLGAAPCPVPAGRAAAGRLLAAVGPANAGERALGPWHVAYYLAE
jgi:maltooligosyltrehalose trehalohydrolase